MSLGVKLLWRARPCISLVPGLSLVPRESRNPPWASKWQAEARCWLSSATESGLPESGPPEAPPPVTEQQPESSIVRRYETGEKAGRALRDAAEKKPFGLAEPTSPFSRPLRHKMKMQVPSERAAAMIKPAIQFPGRRASRRSLRKHTTSVRRQALHEYTRDVLEKRPNDWHSTLDFMLRHTPKFGERRHFKVRIGKGAAAQALAMLSKPDTSLWQIQQRHHCKIRIEPASHQDAPLILSLSGTIVSVQESLLELVRAIGRVSAVRVVGHALQIPSPETWKDGDRGQLLSQPPSNGETAATEDETITVYGHTTADLSIMAQPPKRKLYQLTTPADEIPRPTVWTKSSFEQYVAKLVLARVPTHLHRSLYPQGPDHQTTVVRLLTRLFTSDDLRAAASVSALKMALQFIHARGPIFRPAARAIFYEARLRHLPLDAEAFHTFLTSASRAGDLQGFNSVLRAMHNEGHYIRVETWTAFLAMIQHPQIKSYIIKRMRSRGLPHLQPILEELGRQRVMIDLEHHGVKGGVSIRRLLDAQDTQYGLSWLDTMTLNRMIDVLGAHGDLAACDELLASVSDRRRAQPDCYTLNTLITHTSSIPGMIALLSRWPGIEPDVVTYQQFFRAAWKQRLPNMLRVIWRYSALAGLANAAMRHALTKLIRQKLVLSNNHAIFRAWEDVILGRRELAAGRASTPNGPGDFGARALMAKYVEDAGDLRPLVKVEVKLREAYDMDMTIHKLRKEGVEVSPAMRDSLTVDIPLGVLRRTLTKYECGSIRHQEKAYSLS
ncbi:hypothetical protein GGR51DRAFT_424573 [Nemania sp. FL0031]|nr:hypothetical protein GGR51DRAFT_424573 [Nemania sp. FL0031]